MDDSDEIRRSRRTCWIRFGATVRKDADRPTSVRSISARLGPNQSIEESPEAFRNGRIASESGWFVAAGAGVAA
jgi:uncharacterized protein (DUF3084 family)